MSHLKRLQAPTFWKVPKKENRWAVSPSPGPHKKMSSVPLSVILTHMINAAETTTEAKKIIRKGEVFVDGKRRKDHGYPAGLFDTISIEKLNKSYRLVPASKGMNLIEIGKEANVKICRIDNKSVLKSGRMQLNLNDGKNILAEDNNYNTGDSLLIELPSLKIVEHFPLEKGNVGIIIHGTDSGKMGEVKEVVKGTMKEPQKIVCEVEGERKIISKESFIVVGKEKPAIKVV